MNISTIGFSREGPLAWFFKEALGTALGEYEETKAIRGCERKRATFNDRSARPNELKEGREELTFFLRKRLTVLSPEEGALLIEGHKMFCAATPNAAEVRKDQLDAVVAYEQHQFGHALSMVLVYMQMKGIPIIFGSNQMEIINNREICSVVCLDVYTKIREIATTFFRKDPITTQELREWSTRKEIERVDEVMREVVESKIKEIDTSTIQGRARVKELLKVVRDVNRDNAIENVISFNIDVKEKRRYEIKNLSLSLPHLILEMLKNTHTASIEDIDRYIEQYKMRIKEQGPKRALGTKGNRLQRNRKEPPLSVETILPSSPLSVNVNLEVAKGQGTTRQCQLHHCIEGLKELLKYPRFMEGYVHNTSRGSLLITQLETPYDPDERTLTSFVLTPEGFLSHIFIHPKEALLPEQGEVLPHLMNATPPMAPVSSSLKKKTISEMTIKEIPSKTLPIVALSFFIQKELFQISFHPIRGEGSAVSRGMTLSEIGS